MKRSMFRRGKSFRHRVFLLVLTFIAIELLMVFVNIKIDNKKV